MTIPKLRMNTSINLRGDLQGSAMKIANEAPNITTDKTQKSHKNSKIYTDILQEKTKKNADNLLVKFDDPEDAYKYASKQESAANLDDQDIYTVWGMETRGALHFDEARDLITALSEAPTSQDIFELDLTETFGDDGWVKKRTTPRRMNRQDMISRLEWISNLDFGDSIDDWGEWLKIRSEEGFWSMR